MSTDFKDPEQWISQAEAARLRGVSRQAIAAQVRKGRFTILKLGGRTLLKRVEVVQPRYAPLAGRPPRAR